MKGIDPGKFKQVFKDRKGLDFLQELSDSLQQPLIREILKVETTIPDNSVTDLFLLNTVLAAFTVHLPPAITMRDKIIKFLKVDSAARAITLNGHGSETINGAATVATMDAAYDTITLYCDGIEYFILCQKIT